MKNFIKSLKRPDNEPLIEAILKGYSVIFENNESADLVAEARKYKTADEFVEDGYLIRKSDKNTPMSDWGHAMFAEKESDLGNAYGQNAFYVKKNELTDSSNMAELIKKAWNKESRLDDLNKNLSVPDAEYFNELSADDVVKSFTDIKDIVNSADGYDSDLFQWLFEQVIEPNDIKGIKLENGGIVFDDSFIKTKKQLTDIWNKAHNQLWS